MLPTLLISGDADDEQGAWEPESLAHIPLLSNQIKPRYQAVH